MRINRGLLLGLLASMVAGSVPRMSAPKAVSAGSERGVCEGRRADHHHERFHRRVR